MEMTPLLDVILIMLFVLLVHSRAQVESAESAVAAANSESDTLRQELALSQQTLEELQRRERTLDVVDAQSLLLTISLQDGTVRRVLIEDEKGTASFISLDSQRINDASERLHDTIWNRITEWQNESVFLVFQYDRNTVYHAEYELITSVIRALKPELSQKGYYLNIIEIDLQKE